MGKLLRFPWMIPTVMGGKKSQAQTIVDAYASASGMETAKKSRLTGLVNYLIGAGLWSHVKHLYITVKGFNADTGATIYDIVLNGADLTQTGCSWPTVEGQALTVNSDGTIASGVALIPTTGDNTVVHGFRYMRFVSETANRIWRQGSTNVYGLVLNYDATRANQKYYFTYGDAVQRNMTSSYRAGNWTDAFFDQGYWKPGPVAVVLDSVNGRGYAYMNRDLCSVFSTSEGGNDGVAIESPAIDDAIFQINVTSGRTAFDLEYMLVMDMAISGAQYQSITYEIEKAIAPRNSGLVQSHHIWVDSQDNHLPANDSFIYYDSLTDKYYRYCTPGSLYSGTPPAEAPLGVYQGILAYSSVSLAGPWIYEGIAWSINDAAVSTACGGEVAGNIAVARPSVIYHTVRQKYILCAKIVNNGVGAHRLLLLAEADSPAGPYTTSYAGPVNSAAIFDLMLFKDTDDTAYLVYHDGDNLKIIALNVDYDDTTGSPADVTVDNVEAPGMVKVGSRYWIIGSENPSWTPTTHRAFYSDAANPLSGWTDATPTNPFDSTDEDYEQSFMSQSYGLCNTRSGDIIYNGVYNCPMYYAPFGRRNTAMRPVVLPVTIAGDAMTISWDPAWDSMAYDTAP